MQMHKVPTLTGSFRLLTEERLREEEAIFRAELALLDEAVLVDVEMQNADLLKTVANARVVLQAERTH